jgi:hypothetical protein
MCGFEHAGLVMLLIHRPRIVGNILVYHFAGCRAPKLRELRGSKDTVAA